MSTARNNAELIAQAAQLGYLPGPVLDATHGLGRFWSVHRPDDLTTMDLDPGRAGSVVGDFTALPFADRSFASVVLDPPYKLNGTSTGRGAAASDRDYGVAGADWSRLSWQDRHALIRAGIGEAARVARRVVLVKCQDQVCSGRVRWQTREFADHAESLGCRLVDQLHLGGMREQPAGRRQVHARRNYSTLLVLAVPS